MAEKIGGTLSEQVYSVLREQILSGTLRPGHRLKEVEIAEAYNVSPTPVREAIRRLAQEGLAQSQHYRGTVVTIYTEHDFINLYQVRELLEVPAIRLAIDKPPNSEEIEKLQKLLEIALNALNQGDFLMFERLDLEFHETLVSVTGNPFLASTARNVHEKIQTIKKIAVPATVIGRVSHDEHEKLVDTVVAGDADSAELLLRQHIRRNRDSIFSDLRHQSIIDGLNS